MNVLDKEKIINALINQHGLSEAEAEGMYKNAVIVIETAKNAWDELVDRMREIMAGISDYFAEREYFEPNTLWMPVLDTRKESQVLMNKPRFLVRKII